MNTHLRIKMAFISTFLVALVVLLLVKLFMATRRSSSLPPGPPTMPFVGNLNLDMSDIMKLFRDLRKKYGDVFSLILGKRTLIVVCGVEKIREVLVKHADITSDRPDDFMFEVLCQHNGIVSSNGKQWKDIRTTIMVVLRDGGVWKKYIEAKILEEVECFLSKIKETNRNPFDIKALTNISVSNVICSITFGVRHEYDDTDFIKMIHLTNSILSNANLLGLLLFLPILRYLPFDPLGSNKLMEHVNELRGYCRQILDDHRTSFDSKDIRDIVDLLIDKQNTYGRSKDSSYSDDMVAHTLVDFLIGGSETTVTVLSWLYLYMIKYPEVQKRMRKEIIDHIGTEKRVTWQDRTNLHYCEAVIQETLRLGNIAPLGTPHVVSQDFMLDGNIIPQGAIIMPSLDSVHFEPQNFEDADTFKPERFLEGNRTVTNVKNIMPFSTGPRSCIGESLARMELFTFSTNLLQSFELLPETSKTVPSLAYTLGVTRAPKPYLIRAVPI